MFFTARVSPRNAGIFIPQKNIFTFKKKKKPFQSLYDIVSILTFVRSLKQSQKINEIMIHEFKSQSGRAFTAEKKDGKYIINGCAVAEKNFCWFGVNGTEAEKLCANIGAPKSASVKIILDRAEFSRLMAAFATEEQEVLSGLPVQYRIEDLIVDADGDKVAIGKKITEYKVDESGNEHVIIIREFKNNELEGQDITEKNMAEIIERAYTIREARKIAEASKQQEYEITYHGDHEMWNGVRMD